MPCYPNTRIEVSSLLNEFVTVDAVSYFDRNQLLNGTWLDAIFDNPDEIARERIIVAATLKADELGCKGEFKAILSAYRRAFAALQKENSRADAAKKRRESHLALETNQYGRPMATVENFRAVLEFEPQFASLRYNTMRYSPEHTVNGKIVRWTDADDAFVRWFVEKKYHFHSVQKCDDALRMLFKSREYNPVRDMIESLTWDGTPRIMGFLTKWLKCEDTPYTREVSRLIFAGGIHRLYNPGCKFDDVPVLIGTKQGEGKSTFVRWLAMSDEFFTEVNEIEGQKGMEAIEGAWICELGELLALTKAREVEAVKSFLSRQVDHYRKPYDKRPSDYKRQCIFIGTTNKEQFLVDRTGNRRFYPVKVNQLGYDLFNHKDEIQADIRQCWAEAKVLYDRGELYAFADRSIINEIRTEQAKAVEDDYRVGMIEAYLEDKDEVCILEIWRSALNNEYTKPNKKESNEIGLILQSMDGWVKAKGSRRTKDFGIQKVWVREKAIEWDKIELPF